MSVPDVNSAEPQHYDGCPFDANGKCECNGPVEWLMHHSKPGCDCMAGWNTPDWAGPCKRCRADGVVMISETLPGRRYDGIWENSGLSLGGNGALETEH